MDAAGADGAVPAATRRSGDMGEHGRTRLSSSNGAGRSRFPR